MIHFTFAAYTEREVFADRASLAVERKSEFLAFIIMLQPNSGCSAHVRALKWMTVAR